MSISVDEIKWLAKLSKLDFDDERAAAFSGDFDEIVEFADRINSQIAGDTTKIREVGGSEIAFADLRKDEVKESLPVEKVTSNVVSEGGYFTVRRVEK